MKCKYCHTEIEQDALFCPNCGKDLSKISRCIKCGELLDKGTNFCPYCGVEQPPEEKETVKPHSKKWLWIIVSVLGVLFLLGIGAGAFIYMQQSSSPNPANQDVVSVKPEEIKPEVKPNDTSYETTSNDVEREYVERESYDFDGYVDKYPVSMHIEVNGTQVTGSYYYTRGSAVLNLSGTKKGMNIDLNETAPDGTPSGHFNGTLDVGIYQGQFINNQGKRMYFVVAEPGLDISDYVVLDE